MKRSCRLLLLTVHGYLRNPAFRCRNLASPFPELQTAAILASTNLRASDAVREGCALVDVQLLERLSGASDHRVRTAALRGLRNRSRIHSEVITRRLLDHESPEYRLTGLEGVRNSGDPELRSSVLRLMEREDHQEVITEGHSVLRFLDARRHSGAPSGIRELTP